MRKPCLTSLLLIIGCLPWPHHAAAQAAPPKAPPPFFTEAADCTAAFQARVVARLTQPRSAARDTAILRDTEQGFIFIGVAYKEGLRNPEADQMLKAAEKRWTKLGKAERETRLATCTTKAQNLMDDVSMLERYLVKNRAEARVERLLAKEGK